MKNLLCFWITIFITTNLFSQDSLTRKNVVAFIPTNLIGRAISVSYYRTIQPNMDLSVKASLSVIKKSEKIRSGIPYPYALIIQDPFWYYNRFTTQIGLLRHNDFVFIEPSLHYGYCYFTNQTIQMPYASEASETYWRLDRKFHSIGCMLYTGFCLDYNRFRTKLFGGMGYDLRFYQENIHEKWSYDFYYTNIDNTVTRYTKNHVAFKIGIELGFKF